MQFEYIRYQREGAAGIISLNRPDTMNRMSLPMLIEIKHAMQSAADDVRVGAIVLRGEGRAFCAGTDVSNFRERAAHRAATGKSGDEELRDAILRGPDSWVPFVLRIGKPVIAAVQGACVGMGLTTILPLDFRIAAEDARFGMVFVKLGLCPELTSTALLPRMVGEARALDWCLTGRLVPAAEACAAGLVREVVPNDQLLPRALALAEQLAGLSAPAIAATRTLIREQPQERATFTVLRREVAMLDRLYATPEHAESIAAFLEKRAPNFRI